MELVQDISESIGLLVGFDEDSRYWVSLSVRESVTNAIMHGNNQDAAKRVGVRFKISNDSLIICVQDEGGGFDEGQLPDPLEPDNILKPSGRGIFYVRSFMDDVGYRHLPGGGWEMRMEKRLNHTKGDSNDH